MKALLSSVHGCPIIALLWQKEARDKSEISCKRAKCVCVISIDINGIPQYLAQHIS